MWTAASVTSRQAVLVSGLVACLVMAHAAANKWALDDEPIVERNPAAHSVGAAARAFFSPYWPTETAAAGQYRPLTILSYGFDWSLSNGNPAWFHTVNVLLHGVATALAVVVALAWLPPFGALVAGLVFGTHPVHVEAVANVVGRAELLVAIGLLGMILFARKYRRARTSSQRGTWLTLTLSSLLLGLLAKEHAVVGIALVGLDEWLDERREFRRSADLYMGLVALTMAWLTLWVSVAGGFVGSAVNASVRGLSAWERAFTMLGAQPDVVRLLTWPMTLAADYNPNAILRRTAMSLPGLIGLVNVTAISILGLCAVRRAPAVAFGILAAIITYSPTSNFIFPSGVILAERILYLAALAPALAAGWLVSNRFAGVRPRWILAAVGVLVAVYGWRTATRVPVWRDSLSVVVEDFFEMPDNYRARLRVASYLRGAEEKAAALAELMAGSAIFPDDPYTAYTSVPRAIELGYGSLALIEARRAYQVRPDEPRIARLLATSYLEEDLPDSAVIIAQKAMAEAPASVAAAQGYLEVLVRIEAATWRRHLLNGHGNLRIGWLGAASQSLDSAVIDIPETVDDSLACWDLEQGQRLAGLLRADLLPVLNRVRDASAATCTR